MHADANLADEGPNTGQGNFSRAVSDGPPSLGHHIAAAAKKGKRSRSITPEGGLAAHHYNWDDDTQPTEHPLKIEPVKSEWKGFAPGRNQAHHSGYDAQSHGADTSNRDSPHAAAEYSGADVRNAYDNGLVKQEQKPAVDKPQVKRTGLKVKLKFKNG